ncbi:hypothetical protein PoB_003897300 [Plakobranchus ocellatus]|uniref:Uncharacterized protein n=1 Tax=Plakobranchus ocellatus TaxID=259542 RepID=A0AAV4B048_9GAST|nr:hypothetical protein PoB_003897300 [Plakobranchus ocellatus]
MKKPKAKNIRKGDITNKKSSYASGCIKVKEEKIDMNKDEILKCWSEYIELYDGDRTLVKEIKRNFEKPPLKKEEGKYIMNKIWTQEKTAGPEKTKIEMLEPLGEMGITILTNLLNDAYTSAYISSDISESIFIALPKRM